MAYEPSCDRIADLTPIPYVPALLFLSSSTFTLLETEWVTHIHIDDNYTLDNPYRPSSTKDPNP
ncbi:hypothetical protein EDO6_05330 [Paenibacillus xylanexedens]|nr:hypothetical protein EDO6_05330 [Paenibacillus xylanexedens]